MSSAAVGIVVVQVDWFKTCALHHCKSSSCGVCDGAALSHVKHRSVLLVTISGVAIGGGGVVDVVDMYRLTTCGQS